MDLDNNDITDLDFESASLLYVTLLLRGASKNIDFLANHVFRQDGFLTIEHPEGTIQNISETDVVQYTTRRVSAADLECGCE